MPNNKFRRGISILEVLLSIIIISFVLVLLFSLLSQVRNESVRNNITSTFIMNQSLLEELITNDVIDFGVASISSCDTSQFATGVIDKQNVSGSGGRRCIRIEFAKPGIKATVGYIMIYKYYTKYRYDEALGEYVGKSEDDTEWAISYTKGYYTYTNNPSEKCKFNFKELEDNQGNKSISRIDCDEKGTWHRTQQTLRIMPDDISPSVKKYGEGEGPTTPQVHYSISYDLEKNGYADLIIPIETIDGERYDINIPFSYNSGDDKFVCAPVNNRAGDSYLDCNKI